MSEQPFAEALSLNEITQAQHQGRPLAELVPWLFPLRDDVVVNKDAGLMACMAFTGMDTDGVATSVLSHLADALNEALIAQQDEPLMAWWTVRRSKTTDYPVSVFPDPVSQAVDEALHADFLAGKNFVNHHALSLVLQPRQGMARVGERLSTAVSRGESLWEAVKSAARLFLDDQADFAYTAAELDEACVRLDHLAADLVDRLPAIRFRRLAGDELGGFLHALAAPQAADQAAVHLRADSAFAQFLDESIPEGELFPGRDFLLHRSWRDKYTVVVTVGQFSELVALGGLNRLYSIPGELTISYALRAVPQGEAEKHAERMRNYHASQRWSWKATAKAVMDRDSQLSDGGENDIMVNQGKAKMAAQASEALGRFTQRKVAGLWFYCSILCHGDTLEEAEEVAKRVESVLRGARLKPERETVHAVSGFATSLPGMWKECARWRFFNSEAFAMIAPLHTITQGDQENRYLAEQTGLPAPAMMVLPTDYATPFYYNMHMADLGHGFLAGPSRSGKTVLGNLIWSLFRRYPNAQVFVFDKDYSARIPILLRGGAYLDFNSDSGPRFNPIARLAPESLEQTMAWVELLLAQRDYSLSADDSRDLENALRGTIQLGDPSLRTLSAVYSQIGNPRLRSELEAWVGDRALAKYFDNREDGFHLGNLMGIEVGKLLSHPQAALPTMDYCFSRIDEKLVEQRAAGVVRPTVIYIPEIWNLVQKPVFRDKLNDWLKTLAKRCAAVWFDTQSLEDFVQSGIFAAIRDNIPNRIFLPNQNATSESLYRCYSKEFELADSQIQRIAKGTQKRDYFIQQGSIYRMVQPRLAPAVLATLRSDMAAQIVFDKHYQNGQATPGWQARYIAEVQNV